LQSILDFRFKVAYLYVVLAVYTSFPLSEYLDGFHVCNVFKAYFEKLARLIQCFGSIGGDRLKFGDVILTVASIDVIDAMIWFVLGAALIPSVGSYWGINSAGIISMLIAALVVGYVLAGKIQEESRIRAVGKTSVLSAWVMAFYVMISAAANPYYKDWIDETLNSMYATSAWTKTDWYVYGQVALMTYVVLNVVLVLVLTFIGLYAGSMLRKPKKS